jgi:hypothetical protein
MGVSYETPYDEINPPPPPDPVLLIASPANSVLPGIGDGADEPFDTVTFLICKRT